MNEEQKKFLEYLESEEGSRDIDNYFNSIRKKEEIINNRILKIHDKYDNIINGLIDKVISKYNSEKYYFKETSIGYEPRNKLFWLIKDYFIEYGRECTEEEYEKYGNMFTRDMYCYKGHIAHVMDGQGSVVSVFKIEE